LHATHLLRLRLLNHWRCSPWWLLCVLFPLLLIGTGNGGRYALELHLLLLLLVGLLRILDRTSLLLLCRYHGSLLGLRYQILLLLLLLLLP